MEWQAEYKRDARNNYLVLKASEETEQEDYSVRMAEKNEIPGLLPMHISWRDGALFFSYDITSRQSLESLYEKRKMNWEEMTGLLSGIQETLQNMRKYLLSGESLLLEPEFVFLCPDTRRVFLCFFPGKEPGDSILSLAEFLLRSLDHRDGQAVALGYGFYQRAGEANGSVQRILEELLKNCVRQEPKPRILPKEPEPVREAPPEPGEEPERDAMAEGKEQGFFLFQILHPAVLLCVLGGVLGTEILLVFKILGLTEAGGLFFLILAAGMFANRRWKKKQEESEGPPRYVWAEEDEEEEEEEEAYRSLREEMYREDFSGAGDETSVLSEEEETRYLAGTGSAPAVRLITSMPGCPREISLGAEPLLVGKREGQVDLVLSSDTVSRIHASLETEQGRCYVRDKNSKNGTFVNGVRLQIQERKEFKEGDQVAFAEVVYYAVKKER